MAPVLLSEAFSPEVVTGTGHVVGIERLLTAGERSGLEILVAASSISLASVVILLILLGFAAYKTLRTPSDHRFMRTHVVAYFISLLFCDVISAVGSLINGKWMSSSAIQLGQICTAQATLKNAGNLGSAMWSIVIAIHTFCLLVLKWRSHDRVLYITLGLVWSCIGLAVIAGPAAIQNLSSKGPYYGIAGYWCWITDAYGPARFLLEYFWMFASVVVSFVLYTAVFFSLRGNLVVEGWKVRLQSRYKTGERSESMIQAKVFAKHMLLYPIAYIITILPIAIVRYLSSSGHAVRFEVVTFADTIFLLSGFVNVVIFTMTRNLIPMHDGQGHAIFSRSHSHKGSLSSLETQTSYKSNPSIVKPFMMQREKVTVSPTRISVVPPRPARPSQTISKGLRPLSLMAGRSLLPSRSNSKAEGEPPIRSSKLPTRPESLRKQESYPSPVDSNAYGPAQMAAIPLTIPVPSLQPRRALPRRGVSIAPTMKSIYSQVSASESQDYITPISLPIGSKPATPPMPKVLSLEERMLASRDSPNMDAAAPENDAGYSSSEGEREERAMHFRLKEYAGIQTDSDSPGTDRLAIFGSGSASTTPSVPSPAVHTRAKLQVDSGYTLPPETADTRLPPPNPSEGGSVPSEGLYISLSDEGSPLSPIKTQDQPIDSNGLMRNQRPYPSKAVYAESSEDEVSPAPIPKKPRQQRPILRLSTPSDHVELPRDLIDPGLKYPISDQDRSRQFVEGNRRDRPLPQSPKSAHASTHKHTASIISPSPNVSTPLTSLPSIHSRSNSAASSNLSRYPSTLAPPSIGYVDRPVSNGSCYSPIVSGYYGKIVSPITAAAHVRTASDTANHSKSGSTSSGRRGLGVPF